MRVLAIDTALEACAVALLHADSNRVLAFEATAMSRGHAEALMPMLARVMDAAGVEFSDIDRIAVTVGPGSFTGLRVGIAAARGIALATGRPAVGVSTLAAFAAPHVAKRESRALIAAIDARHGHVFVQGFGAGGRTIVPPGLMSIPDAIEAARAGPALIVGSGAAVIAAAWPAGVPDVEIETAGTADIGWIARLGAIADADRAPPKPLYLRLPDAKPQDSARLPRR